MNKVGMFCLFSTLTLVLAAVNPVRVFLFPSFLSRISQVSFHVCFLY